MSQFVGCVFQNLPIRVNKSHVIQFSYNGEKYTNHPKSVNDHYLTTIGDIENKMLALGGGFSTGNTKVELFDINSNTWTTKTSYPFCSSS